MKLFTEQDIPAGTLGWRVQSDALFLLGESAGVLDDPFACEWLGWVSDTII